MVDFKLLLPEDFSEYQAEVESKGWFSESFVLFEGQRFQLNFYDLARLTQEASDALAKGVPFFEENLVIVPRVTPLHMQAAAEHLATTGKLAFFLPYQAT